MHREGQLLKVRFEANPDDPRPVHWPIQYPYWIAGYGEGYAIIVAYSPSTRYIYENWPEARNMSIQIVDGIEFSSRFPRPEWFITGARCKKWRLKQQG